MGQLQKRVSVEVLGISVLLELGRNITNFVNLAFDLRVNVAFIKLFIVLLFLSEVRLKAKYPVWFVQACYALHPYGCGLGDVAVIVYQLEDLRALFQQGGPGRGS